ncbi:MAG TPA: metal-dependent transcriptional regulator, partial [Thermoprotei archaeon]|nr:metal-dependent transcriptional regulator [Thermoprotei archaeon]
LLAIYDLNGLPDNSIYVRPIDISRKLNIARSTVVPMIRRLANKGLVNYIYHRGSKLTERGKNVVEKYFWSHRILETFLVKYLKMNVDDACCYAKKFDLNVPYEVVSGLCELLNHPKCCPHGRPIPHKCLGVEKCIV